MIRNLGMVIIFALLVLSTFIINNTIKLAVNARRKEINIMKYVGATNWFVRWPFFFEGTVLGLLGSVIALVIVMILYKYVYGIMANQFYALIAAYIVSPGEIFKDLLLIFSVIGMGIGALGSLMSMRKYLNV
jgi:cell division transport system permease protein